MGIIHSISLIRLRIIKRIMGKLYYFLCIILLIILHKKFFNYCSKNLNRVVQWKFKFRFFWISDNNLYSIYTV